MYCNQRQSDGVGLNTVARSVSTRVLCQQRGARSCCRLLRDLELPAPGIALRPQQADRKSDSPDRKLGPVMPFYKLIYFDIRGRGEVIRLLLHAGGVSFLDQRVTMDEWPKLKGTMPMKVLPVLEVDGFKMSQSIPIALYLAKEFGFYGSTNKEQFKIDEMVHFLADLQPKFSKVYFEQDPEMRKELTEDFSSTVLPHFLDVIERDLIASKSGFIVGDKLTVADLALFEVMVGPMRMLPDLFRQYPRVLTHHNKVKGHPKVAQYIASRLDSDI